MKKLMLICLCFGLIGCEKAEPKKPEGCVNFGYFRCANLMGMGSYEYGCYGQENEAGFVSAYLMDKESKEWRSAGFQKLSDITFTAVEPRSGE